MDDRKPGKLEGGGEEVCINDAEAGVNHKRLQGILTLERVIDY